MSRGRLPLRRPGVLRWSQARALPRILTLLAGALLVQPGTAAANPWGIGDDQGAAQRPAPGPDWIQGTAAPAAVDQSWSSGDAAGVSDGALSGWPDAARAPAWNRDWGYGGAPGEPPGPAYRFRPDTDDADLPVQGAGALRSVDAPATPVTGYRFRGDSPGSVGAGGASPDPGSYRFRPLTEREQERQGAGAQPRQRPRRPPPPPDAPTDDGSGRWPSW